jgi:hypothetical protein
MSARPSLFKETDVKRAFQAARMAGVDVARVDIGKDGKISIVPREPAKESPKTAPVAGELQPWD